MLIPCTLSHNYYNYRQFKDMVWNMLPKRVARYLRRGRNYAEPFGQASRASAALGGRAGRYLQRGRGGVALPMQGHLSFCITDWRDASIRICFSLYLRCPERGYLELLIGATSNGYLQVSILFCDIVSYTNMSSEMTPDHVVNLLNNVYTYVRGGKKHVEGQGQRLGEAAP